MKKSMKSTTTKPETKPVLVKIAERLVGIFTDDLSEAETQIVDILINEGILFYKPFDSTDEGLMTVELVKK